ncbi:diguanylate cyclase [Bacillus infantis]|nr:sensor domain-containing diguanylate cyclase [Bacillus sp. MMSF_3328]MCA1036415.1 diguanylate cyclase [Bacillus infantis]
MGIMVKQGAIKYIWIIWALTVPAGVWLTYTLYPPQPAALNVDVLAFMLLMFFVSSMPIIINNVPVFMLQWVAFAVFLTFGIFIEMLLVQASVIFLLLKLRLPKSQSYRFPLNSFMFFVVSFISGVFYYSLGGKQGADLMEHGPSLWLSILYPIVYYVVNQLVLSLILFFLHKQKTNFFGKDFIWESLTSIMTLPVGFMLYILYREVGLLSILFVGVPFASLSIILGLYNSSEKVNDYLHKAAEIGHQLAERLNRNEVMELFIEKLIGMLPVDYAYILDVVDESELKLLYQVEDGERTTPSALPLRRNEGISGLVWATGKAALFSTKKEWKTAAKGYMPKEVESVLCVPIARSSKVVGVLLLASRKKRAYEKYQLMIVDILCSHFAVAIENARNYERTKENSERCALTKLYNYRYLDVLLGEEFIRMESGKRSVLSLIILDIDHFKSVNDTFGHQSGNEILIELAERLSLLTEPYGTVARYGGEEFVVLLPDAEKQEALELAEVIRLAIATQPFTITQHMDGDGSRLSVSITASIGVASAPVDADDPLALIRHADRALYVGAKRAGRNRVAEYVK